jgi:hypothetical protein
VRSFLTALVLFAGAAGLSAQDDKKFTSKEGKFAAKFPGEPKTLNQKASGLDMTVTMVEKGKTGFGVIYADLPEGAAKLEPAKLLDGAQNGAVTKGNAKVTKSADLKYKANGKEFPAREFLAERDDQTIRVTLILVDLRLYQVLVVGEKAVVTGKEADEFFKSFELTK